ncbi:putative synoviolin [Fasciolopsis buskii]|uniref:Putative synoviolin n=1 Tax=Fasciolopsis buskii TaxID=27845 RepID=A0A8E0VL36_9TREM|nr:putative synoviolin [Fasciolopsis buski]
MHVYPFCPAATVISILAILFHTVGVFVLSALTWALLAAWTGSVIYALLLHIVSHPWLGSEALVESLVIFHFVIAALLACCTLIYVTSQWQMDSVHWMRVVVLSVLPFFISLIAYLPVLFRFPGEIFTDYCLPGSLTPNPTSPAWFSYAHAMLPRLNSTTATTNSTSNGGSVTSTLAQYISPDLLASLIQAQINTDRSRTARSPDLNAYPQICPATFNPTCVVRESLLTRLFIKINPFALFIAYLAAIWLWTKSFPFFIRLKESIIQEVALYEEIGFFGFVTFHWNRLNVPLALAMLWTCKLTMVVLMGPEMWPVVPDQPTSVLMNLNVTAVRDFIQPPANRSELAKLWNRIYVGAIVHGSETWFDVFGAATFFSGIATVVVHVLVYLLDPSGEDTRRLVAAAVEAPLNLHDWNVIEDPALALDQHDILAAEMLTGTSWNCAVVFLFLAFQYDLPSLPLTQRIWCFLYGLIVIAISCIHPVQALIKSLLLRLGVPGRDGGSWFTHLRLLFSCIFLIFSSVCVITYVPEGLVERIVQQVNMNDTQIPNELSQNISSNVIPRFGSSSKSLRGRQLRIVLCGCQLLLGLVVTLIEYGIYQISRRYPDWGGFRSGLFWTKLISSVIDYLISFMSFLTVCWLAIYDSIGFCRLLIIGCYFFFILYPSALTAYTWLRWRLLARRAIDSLSSPTAAQLEQYQDNCPICYTNMTTEDAKVTRCGHFYHTKCLATWMLRQLFCPICHADLLSTKVQNQRRLGLAQAPAAN